MNLKQGLLLLGILSIYNELVESSLNKYIQHFEPLNYDTSSVHASHKKAMSKGTHYHMQFDAFGLRHNLRLKQDKDLFARGAVIQDGDGRPIELDHSSFITGEVVGDPGSRVHGVVRDGAFHGKIMGSEGKFYVEPAKRYIDDPRFHSVIYRQDDVKYDANYADISKRIAKQPERHRRDATNERPRRATASEMRNNVCKLKLIADDRFTRRFGGKGEAASKIVEHVAAVKAIYSTDFNTTALYAPYSITFRVKQITIYDSSNVPEKYKKDNLGIDPMLDLLTQDNHDDACEAFLFTDRNFEGGILGLAWIGYPSKLGGICSKYSSGGSKSYNTGIVTVQLYGRFTPPRISEITFAHELGHGFGSQHDPEDSDCSPGQKAGNYIMYAKATSGDRSNNDKFSKCSLDSIKENVNAKRSSSFYSGCFSSGDETICGNRVREGDEQCDCGDAISCKLEGDCCNPPGVENECKLKLNKACSPSQGPCCSNKCTYTKDKVCRNGTTCIKEAKCASLSFECPQVVITNPKTLCSENRRVCGNDGSCSLSVCTKYGLEECQCTAKTDLCDICCKNPDKDECLAAKYIDVLPVSLHTVKKIPGSPCSNMQGYCDVFAVCRMVDKAGPLQRLTERFFTVEGLKSTVKEYWWVILIGVLAGIIIVSLMIYVCVRYTPSSNPIREQKRPAKKLPKRRKKNQDRTQDAGRSSPTMELEHQV